MTVVVTGAASGMGRSVVDIALARGHAVVAADLHAPHIPDAVSVTCDVTDPLAIEALVARAPDVTALVHAAGISPTMADARTVLDVDLVATERIIRAFEGTARAAVCFASSAAYELAPFMNDDLAQLIADPLADGFLDHAVEAVANDSGFAYALAKVGVQRSVKRAAAAWGRLGARINSISPGLIDTPMGHRELAQQPVMQDMLARVPLGRLGSAHEVAEVAMFLVSEQAAFVNGIDVLVDGGLYADPLRGSEFDR